MLTGGRGDTPEVFMLQVSKVYLDEGLVVQGGVSLLQPHTLLLVLLQSQRVDGEKGHVGLEGVNTEREGSISKNGLG